MTSSIVRVVVALLLLLSRSVLLADGTRIDKVYDPYVHMLEQELEYRALLQQDSDPLLDGVQLHKVGYGRSFSDQFFGELYLIGSNEEGNGLQLESTELELKWQLTEQGQYYNDYGLLFELEYENDLELWEATSTLVLLHEWQDWVATANISILYEWGESVNNEWETLFSGQLRYRFSSYLEPAIEFYQAQDTQGIGPVLTGLLRIGQGDKLYWRAGVIAGTDKVTPAMSWVLSLEYEFR